MSGHEAAPMGRRVVVLGASGGSRRRGGTPQRRRLLRIGVLVTGRGAGGAGPPSWWARVVRAGLRSFGAGGPACVRLSAGRWTAAARCWTSAQAVTGRRRFDPRLGGGDPDLVGRVGVTADWAAVTSYGSMTAVVTERSSGVFISQDPVVDFGGEMQIMDGDLTQRDGCAAAAVASHVAAGIVEKWW